MQIDKPTIYRGNCHCGRYRFELSLPGNIKTATACTCSLCAIKGYLWIIPPVGSFRVIRDDGLLRDYTSKAISDKVQPESGTAPFSALLTTSNSFAAIVALECLASMLLGRCGARS